MQRKATLSTIAKDLGISVGTISRVLNGKGKEFRISDKTIEQVIAHAKKVGYTPDLLAKSLRSSKTQMLGFVVPDISNPFFAQLAKEIERTAKSFNYSMIFVDSDENTEEEQKQLQNLLNRKVDGIVAAPVGVSYDHFITVKQAHVPLLMVDRYFPDFDVPFIATDNYLGAKSAINHLISCGHKRIAVIQGNKELITVKERLRGYVDALSENQFDVEDNLVLGEGFSIDVGIQSTLALLESKKPPSAIFAMSNQLGLGVLEATRLRNLQIPDRLSLVVFDDQPYAAHIQPALSTIKQNISKIGQLAVEAILQMIDNPETPFKSTLIEPDFIPRSSVSTLIE